MLGPSWDRSITKTNVINFMTKIRLRLGMLVNTTPDHRNAGILTLLESLPLQRVILNSDSLHWISAVMIISKNGKHFSR